MTDPLVEIIGDGLFDYCDKLGLPPSITRPYGFAEQIAGRVRTHVAAEIAEAIDSATNGVYIKIERAVEIAHQHATNPKETS